MARTRTEIAQELEALREILGQIPPQSIFGDDNEEAVGAQIRVIEGRMDYNEAVDEFEGMGDYIISSAQDAVRWLFDDDISVVDAWYEMAAENTTGIEQLAYVC